MSRLESASRWVLSLVMIGVGTAHFLLPGPLVRIVPAWLPEPLLLVYVSGVAEIAGGVGLQIPPLRRAAAWGLIALYVAVFPANVNQAVNHISFGPGAVPSLVLWSRLPLQAALVYWAWTFTRREPARS